MALDKKTGRIIVAALANQGGTVSAQTKSSLRQKLGLQRRIGTDELDLTLRSMVTAGWVEHRQRQGHFTVELTPLGAKAA